MAVSVRGWCRVDLAGGTLDIWPLGVLHPGSRTVNLAIEVPVVVRVRGLESGFSESTVYCSQCVSVFQKRDVVSIEQQTAKLGQIKTWERWTTLLRRVGGFVVPGSSDLLDGRILRGMTVGFLASFFLTGALIWVPMFLPRIEGLAASQSLATVLLALYGLLALRSGMSAWNRR